jgi:hypothetical protein
MKLPAGHTTSTYHCPYSREVIITIFFKEARPREGMTFLHLLHPLLKIVLLNDRNPTLARSIPRRPLALTRCSDHLDVVVLCYPTECSKLMMFKTLAVCQLTSQLLSIGSVVRTIRIVSWLGCGHIYQLLKQIILNIVCLLVRSSSS